MAVRAPLYINDDGDLQEMSLGQVQNYVLWTKYQFGLSPTVTLAVVTNGDGDNKFEMENNYYKAGAAGVTNTSFPAAIANIVLETLTYKTIKETVAVTSPPAFSDPIQDLAFPVYFDADKNIRAMSQQDMLDTFINPALASFNNASTGSSDSPGGYFISPDNTGVTGATIVSNDPVFTDSISSEDFQTGNLPEAIDQQQDVTNWYLWKIDAAYAGDDGSGGTITDPYADASTGAWPLVYNATDKSLTQIAQATFNSYLSTYMSDASSNTVGSRLRYFIYDTTDPNYDADKRRGFGMTDRTRENTQLRRIQQIGDNYYAQNVPNGVIATTKTYYLQLELV